MERWDLCLKNDLMIANYENSCSLINQLMDGSSQLKPGIYSNMHFKHLHGLKV